jgi:hypothetical protein
LRTTWFSADFLVRIHPFSGSSREQSGPTHFPFDGLESSPAARRLGRFTPCARVSVFRSRLSRSAPPFVLFGFFAAAVGPGFGPVFSGARVGAPVFSCKCAASCCGPFLSVASSSEAHCLAPPPFECLILACCVFPSLLEQRTG